MAPRGRPTIGEESDSYDKPMKRAKRRQHEPTKTPETLTQLVKLLDKTVECWPSVYTIEYIRAAASGARDMMEQEEKQL